MEALGGFAIAGALIYGGFRVIETGATPGQFFSFLAAFMLAYEPAKRLARLNIDLNSGLVGVRILFEIIDHPPTEPPDDDKPPLKLSDRARRVRQRAVRLPSGREGHQEPVLRRRAREGDRAGRPVRRRQVDHPQPDPALLRGRRRRHRHRRPEHRGGVAPLAAQPDRLCRPGRVPVPRLDPREHRARPARRDRGRDRRRRQGRPCARLHHGLSARLRHAGRRARHAARPAASASASRSRARCSRTRRSSCSTRPPPRSIPESERQVQRRDRASLPRAHHDRDRAPPAHHRRRRPHLRGRGRHRGRNPAGTTNCCARAGATPRSTACSCGTRSPSRAGRRSHPPLEF